MHKLMILSSLMLAWACGSQSGKRSIPNTSDPVDHEEASSETVPTTPQPEESSLPVEEVEATSPEETAPPEAAAPTATKRYRRGGGKVRKGSRATELKQAVNGAGKRVTLESQKAPVLVLTFGASWCAPCKKELPALEKLAKRYARTDVAFVAVNIDSTIAKGKTFMKQAGLKRVLAVYDPKNISVRSYAPPTMPSVFIMNEGVVKHVHPGFRSGDERKLKKAIDRELQ
jgi:thiol-disulfide isomerase/thioredoxin